MLYQTGWMKFKTFSDGRGNLTAIEGDKDLPFSVRRVYYITGVQPGVQRGFHSHRTLHQVLLCLHGSLKLRVYNGNNFESVTLCKPDEGFYIGPMVWREMYDFSEGSVLLVLASAHYDETDYLRDFEAYLKEASTYYRLGEDNA